MKNKKKPWSPFGFLWIPRKGKTLGGCQVPFPLKTRKKLFSGHQMRLLSIQMRKKTWWPPSLLYSKKKRKIDLCHKVPF
jgi:hypothetical protein